MLDLDELDRLLAEATPGPWIKRGLSMRGEALLIRGGDLFRNSTQLPEIDVDAIVALRNSAGRLLALARAGERMAVAVEAVAEGSTRLMDGKYVLRTHKGSDALEKLFVANREWKEAAGE